MNYRENTVLANQSFIWKKISMECYNGKYCIMKHFKCKILIFSHELGWVFTENFLKMKSEGKVFRYLVNASSVSFFFASCTERTRFFSLNSWSYWHFEGSLNRQFDLLNLLKFSGCREYFSDALPQRIGSIKILTEVTTKQKKCNAQNESVKDCLIAKPQVMRFIINAPCTSGFLSFPLLFVSVVINRFLVQEFMSPSRVIH